MEKLLQLGSASQRARHPSNVSSAILVEELSAGLTLVPVPWQICVGVGGRVEVEVDWLDLVVAVLDWATELDEEVDVELALAVTVTVTVFTGVGTVMVVAGMPQHEHALP
jgi:hypothetical protein